MDTAGVSSKSLPARRSARPPRPSRGRMIRIRVSEEEYAELATKGEAVGGMSALLRDHLGKVSVRHRDDEKQRVVALNRINANLNMIAKWVNTYKGAADAVQVMVYLADVGRELGRVLAAMDHPTPSGLRVADRPTPKGSGPARRRR